MCVFQEECTSEEERVDAAVTRALKGNGQLVRVWGNTLYHPEDLPYNKGLSNMGDVFTPFRDKCERNSQVRPGGWGGIRGDGAGFEGMFMTCSRWGGI